MKRSLREMYKSSGDTVRRLDRMVSLVFAVGQAIAVILVVVGAVLALTGRGSSLSSEVSVADVPRALGALEPIGFVGLGLLVLLLTPIARAMALMVEFARKKSWVFCCMSVLVLALLALSAYLGVVG